jgi:hypothetical protein
MTVRKILQDLTSGKISLEEAEKRIRLFEVERICDWGNIDTHRELRTGAPEAVFGEGKDDAMVLEIVKGFIEKSGRCIVTRLSEERMEKIAGQLPEDYRVKKEERAGILVVKAPGYKTVKTGGRVAILAAGTTDIRAAEEARIMAEEMGCQVFTFYDVGVAGIHRTMPAVKAIVEKDVDAVVVAAGMEGALPSVVAGMLDVPVVGLPISSGYGYGGKGKSALMSILQSCSPGLCAVNIDNGFTAGVVAALIANRAARFR